MRISLSFPQPSYDSVQPPARDLFNVCGKKTIDMSLCSRIGGILHHTTADTEDGVCGWMVEQSAQQLKVNSRDPHYNVNVHHSGR